MNDCTCWQAGPDINSLKVAASIHQCQLNLMPFKIASVEAALFPTVQRGAWRALWGAAPWWRPFNREVTSNSDLRDLCLVLGTHGQLYPHPHSLPLRSTNHTCDVSFNITIYQDTCNAGEDKSFNFHWILLVDQTQQLCLGSLQFIQFHLPYCFISDQLPISFIQAEENSTSANAAMQWVITPTPKGAGCHSNSRTLEVSVHK